MEERTYDHSRLPASQRNCGSRHWAAMSKQKVTSVSLSDQGLVQLLEAAVTGLEAGKHYVLALASKAAGGGVLQPLQDFLTNPAGAAVVNAIGPIQLVTENPAHVRETDHRGNDQQVRGGSRDSCLSARQRFGLSSRDPTAVRPASAVSGGNFVSAIGFIIDETRAVPLSAVSSLEVVSLLLTSP
jgi:hypothetical protein